METFATIDSRMLSMLVIPAGTCGKKRRRGVPDQVNESFPFHVCPNICAFRTQTAKAYPQYTAVFLARYH